MHQVHEIFVCARNRLNSTWNHHQHCCLYCQFLIPYPYFHTPNGQFCINYCHFQFVSVILSRSFFSNNEWEWDYHECESKDDELETEGYNGITDTNDCNAHDGECKKLRTQSPCCILSSVFCVRASSLRVKVRNSIVKLQSGKLSVQFIIVMVFLLLQLWSASEQLNK